MVKLLYNSLKQHLMFCHVIISKSTIIDNCFIVIHKISFASPHELLSNTPLSPGHQLQVIIYQCMVGTYLPISILVKNFVIFNE